MKKGILRILLGIFLPALGIMAAGCSSSGPITYKVYTNADSYIAGSRDYSSEEIKSVDLDWICGIITVTENEEGITRITESGTDLPEEQQVRSRVENGVLRVRFWKSGYTSEVDDEKKHISLEIPRGTKLEITSISANVKATDLTSPEIKIVSVSGSVSLGNVSSETVNILTTSGAIKTADVDSVSANFGSVSGEISSDSVTATEDADFYTTSGEISISSLSSPEADVKSISGSIKIASAAVDSLATSSTSGKVELGVLSGESYEIKTVSGSVKISLLSDEGATVSFSSVSGSFTAPQHVSENDNHVFGQGKTAIKVSTTSGSLTIA